MSSAVLFGGAALSRVDQGSAGRVLDLLLERGVNHIDTAPAYGDPELRIGPWMDRHRDDFFLATKTRERDCQGARRDIHNSLERMRTDRIDLLQLHALVHPDQWDRALSPGGALDAAVEAREESLVRFIGVTGNGWSVAAMHRRSLERVDFDSVLNALELFLRLPRDLRRRFRGDPGAVRAAQCRGADDQVDRTRGHGPRGRCAIAPPGISRSRTRTTSAPRSVGSWRGRGSSSTRSATSACCPSSLRTAAEPGDVPEAAVMVHLRERAGLSSIFGL